MSDAPSRSRRRPRRRNHDQSHLDLSGSTIVGPLRPLQVGGTTHATIYSAVRKGMVRPTGQQLLDHWSELALGREELTYNLVERQIAVTRTNLYFNLFPPGHDWKLLGTEVAFEASASRLESDEDMDEVVSGRFDLVFDTPDGVVVDELKTGRLTDELMVGLPTQVESYRQAGIALYGERFAGLRVLLLMSRKGSFFVAPDGTHTPLPPR